MKKIKFNWGFGITLTYTLFVVVTLVMVYFFMKQDVSLETENYYTKGIEYQKQIEKIERTNALAKQLEISLTHTNIVFTYPMIFPIGDFSGTIFFYRPDNKKLDFTSPVSPDSIHTQMLSTSTLEKGLWKIKIDWNVKNISYYTEKLVMVN